MYDKSIIATVTTDDCILIMANTEKLHSLQNVIFFENLSTIEHIIRNIAKKFMKQIQYPVLLLR